MAHYLIFTRRGGNEDEEVVPGSVDTKVKKAPKVEKVKVPLVVEEGDPEPQRHIEDSLPAVKQELATPEIGDEKASVKLISAKVEVANMAPKLVDIVEPELSTSLVAPKPVTVKLEEPVNLEKVPEVQTTLLSAGFRSRRAVSTRSKEDGLKPNNLKGSDLPVQATNFASNEAADAEVEKEEPTKRRGRPRKNPPSGKASFYGSAPRTRNKTKPESGTPVLVLDSDSEDFNDTEGVTIAQRLQRRRVT